MPTAFVSTLVDIIKKTNTVPRAALERALEIQRSTGKKLVHILVDQQMIPESQLMSLLSEATGIPVVDLKSFQFKPAVLKLIPKQLAERHEMIPLSQTGETLVLAMSDPFNVFALDDVKRVTNLKPQPALAVYQDIRAAIESRYAVEANLEEILKDLDPDSITVVSAEEEEQEEDAGSGAYSVDAAPVIRMVNAILEEAIKSRASDIHFEPFADRLRIRFRIDGSLREALTPPRNMYNALLTRIKILSDLDITEKRLPQDGRFKTSFMDREIDFRVSVLPTQHGEKTVLRVLDKSGVKSGLEELGFSAACIKQFYYAIQKPYGIVLVTGPTGSGKSTTLYTILSGLNTKERNIMTVEDPIEYQIHGITQTQANPDIGLTFANGLRALLRQSPDIILVGEIRDTETADIAVKAALTGHLVFSTLHTNNAAGAVTRLVDMGVEPFLIASALISATAQRLMRRICPHCKEPCKIPDEAIARLPAETMAGGKSALKDSTAYHGRGCEQCNQTGYRGRLGAMEILQMDERLQQMVIERKSSGEIEAYARKNGMRSLFENALEQFLNGMTTLEEVLRITTFEG